MKSRSIALIRQRYAEDGGAERFVARALDALKGQDVRATLITRAWNKGDDFDVVTVSPFYIGRLWRDWSFAQAVCKLLKTRPFDLVQSHERIPCCDIYRAGDGVHREWLKQRARTLSRWRRWRQAINPYHLYVQWAEKRVFTHPRLKAVICNSRMVKEEVKRYFGVADDKLHVIYNGIDLDEFHPGLRRHRGEVRARFNIPDAATLFLLVGSGFERKGVALLLDAMAELPASAYLMVVGRDKKLPLYRRRARKLGLADRVIFTGSEPDVRPYYGAADAFVLPTLYDPFPNAVLEALACALPVVTSTKSGAAEFVQTDRNGYVCDALDRHALVAALQSVRQRFSGPTAAARATIQTLDLKQMGDALAALYQRLLTPRA